LPVVPTLVKQGASIGAGATILCGTTIGRHAMVAMGAAVTRDVPDHGLVKGVPAVLCGWVDEAGAPLTPVDDTRFRSEDGRCFVLTEAGLREERP
jgi:UDP-2-acetamido-3-amino-2,3-dideoxy-glucuronate N-acetyltransferase